MPWNGQRTICEVLRESADLCASLAEHAAQTGPDVRVMEIAHELMCRAIEAMRMAKRMDRKLREYEADYDAGWWERVRERVQQGEQWHG